MKSDIIVIDQYGKRKVVHTIYRDRCVKLIDKKFLFLIWQDSVTEYCESVQQFQNRCISMAEKLQSSYEIVYVNLTTNYFDIKNTRTIWKNGGWCS